MASHVQASSDEQFDRDVLDVSEHQLVLVEVGAEWCAPCRALIPVLNTLADELAGQLTLVTLNADECPNTMARLAIRGLPTVLLFKQRVVIDRFQGGLAEKEVRAFLKSYVTDAHQYWVIRGQQRLSKGDVSGIEDLRHAVHLTPGNSAVLAILINALLDSNAEYPEWLQEAETRLNRANVRLQRDPLMQQVRSRLRLVSVANTHQHIDVLRQACDLHGLCVHTLDLANALAAQEAYADALGLLLDILKQPDDSISEEGVRSTFIALLNTCPDRQLANDHRRQFFALSPLSTA